MVLLQLLLMVLSVSLRMGMSGMSAVEEVCVEAVVVGGQV